jgi:FMN phosphatase YigB (HAD superfamily)
LDANRVGIHAVWFNPGSGESRKGEWHKTVHSMAELLSFFKSL